MARFRTDGGYLNFAGRHFRVNSAKLWDLPDPPPGIGIAASGPASCELAGRHAAALIAVEPDADLVRRFDRAGGGGRPRSGQVPISWGPSREEAIDRAHNTFHWFGGGWKVDAELPGTPAFEAATQFATKDDVARSIPCGPDLDGHVQAVRQYLRTGFTDVAVVQIGGDT